MGVRKKVHQRPRQLVMQRQRPSGEQVGRPLRSVDAYRESNLFERPQPPMTSISRVVITDAAGYQWEMRSGRAGPARRVRRWRRWCAPARAAPQPWRGDRGSCSSWPPVSRYRQGGSGREGSGRGRCVHEGCGRKGSMPSPAASAPLDRCEGQRGIDLGHGSPDGRRGLAVSLTEQLGCLCGGFLGLAEVLFYVHWPSSRLVACYWSDTAPARPPNWSGVR